MENRLNLRITTRGYERRRYTSQGAEVMFGDALPTVIL